MGENEVNEAVAEVDGAAMDNEGLKEAINKQLEKIRNDAIIVGYRVACKMVVDMIAPLFDQHPTYRDYERSIKRLNEFCSKALSNKTAENNE